MFETLSDRLGAILDKLTRKGALDEADVNEAMREVRRALLEADVALDVVRDFTDAVRAKAVGQEVVRSITPGQMVSCSPTWSDFRPLGRLFQLRSSSTEQLKRLPITHSESPLCTP